MKLRNKKTEETGNLLGMKVSAGIIWVNIEFHDREPRAYCYDSLAGLNEEWEDYKPAEPLIEDKKARKVFRAWAEFFGAECFRVSHIYNSGKGRTTTIGSTDLTTEPLIELPGYIGEDSKEYTKIELCGEEEECER